MYQIEGKIDKSGKSGASPGATSQDLEVRAALERLKALMPSKLQNDAAEFAVLSVIQGASCPQKIEGQFLVLSHHSPDETVVFVYDPTTRLSNKYIITAPLGIGRSFVVSMPMDWTPMHRDILARIEAATGVSHRCCGGGFAELTEGDRDIKLLVSGESGDFGPGDHDRAYAAFQRAAESSPGPQVQNPDDDRDL